LICCRITKIYPPAKFRVHPIRMSQDDHTAQQHLTPDERRTLLRAFADRMLLKVTAMDDPEDLPGVEKAVRTAAMIERVYSRCDRAERQIRDTSPDSRKAEAERAIHEEAAIKAQVSLAGTLKWSEERRRDLGQWWEAAQRVTQNTTQDAIKTVAEAPVHPQKTVEPEDQLAEAAFKAALAAQKVTYVDYTEAIESARAELALQRREAKAAKVPSLHTPPQNSG